MRAVSLRFIHPGVQDDTYGQTRIVATPDFGAGCRVEVQFDDGVPVRVEARRGLTTSNELYWVTDGSGRLLVTDHFAHAVDAVPPAQRSLPQEAVLDHLLFRTTPGTGTCLPGVERLGHGEVVIWEAPAWGVTRRQAERLELPETVPFERGLETVEDALARAVADLSGCGLGARINLLSGGIDSTLLHTFLGRNVPSASAGIDSPEFALEVGYAKEASILLGTDHQFTGIREEDYASCLKECVRVSGIPPHHLQTVLLDLAFQAADPGAAFLTAQFADGLFGLGRAERAVRLERLGSLAAALAPWALFPGRLGRRAKTALSIRRALRRPPEDPDSYAAGFAVYGDQTWAEQAFGRDAVRHRLEARLEYLARLLPTADWLSPTTEANLTIGHLLDFWLDDTVSVWRQVAHARSVSLSAPFTHPEVVKAALSLAPMERYVRHGVTKPALKTILARRLPTYPVNQAKGASGLPLCRMVRAGVLGALAAKYAAPIPGMAGSALPLPTTGAGLVEWAALSLGLWWESIGWSQGERGFLRPITDDPHQLPGTSR